MKNAEFIFYFQLEYNMRNKGITEVKSGETRSQIMKSGHFPLYYYIKIKDEDYINIDVNLRLNSYDDSVLKALLYTVSLYPLGSYVYLSNRKVGMVSDTNPDNPKYPIVQLLTERNPDGSPILIPSDPDGINILRNLSIEEIADIKKLIAKQNNKDSDDKADKSPSADNSASENPSPAQNAAAETAESEIDLVEEITENEIPSPAENDIPSPADQTSKAASDENKSENEDKKSQSSLNNMESVDLSEFE